MTKKPKSLEPVKEIGEIPFALCEIVSALEQAGQPEEAAIAESIVGLIMGISSLSLIQIPDDGKERIKSICMEYLSPSRS